jgi:hypothetical protein
MRQEGLRQRWVPLTGILFGALFVVGIILADQPPTYRNDIELIAFYRDTGNRLEVLTGGYLLTLAGVILLPFLGTLRRVIQAAEGEGQLQAGLVSSSGAVLVGLVLAGAAASVVVPAGVYFDDNRETPLADPDLARYLTALGYTLIFLMGMFVAAVLIATTALASHRHSLFPSWFNWLSIACVPALLLSAPLEILGLALPVWITIASILLVRRQSSASQAVPQ